jgi:cystathionine beta-lyase/cystathionine gamma-synthase
MTIAADPLARAMEILAHDDSHAYDAVVPPIAQTSLFTFGSYAEMEETYRGLKVRPTYTRGLNPTVRLFEEKIAALECGEDAIGFASGMAAISSTVLAFVRPGDRIVCVEHVYPDAYRLFETYLKRMQVTVDYVDGRDLDAVRRVLPGARLFYMESPTSWLMHVHDVSALAKPFRSSITVGRVRSSSSRSPAASTWWSIPHQNILAATAMWWPVW